MDVPAKYDIRVFRGNTYEKYVDGDVTLPAGLVWYVYLSRCNAAFRASPLLGGMMFSYVATLGDSVAYRGFSGTGYTDLPETLPETFPSGLSSSPAVVMKLVDYEI